MEHQIKVVREGLKTLTQFPVNFLYSAFFLSSRLAKLQWDVGLDPPKKILHSHGPLGQERIQAEGDQRDVTARQIHLQKRVQELLEAEQLLASRNKYLRYTLFDFQIGNFLLDIIWQEYLCRMLVPCTEPWNFWGRIWTPQDHLSFCDGDNLVTKNWVPHPNLSACLPMIPLKRDCWG